MKIYKHTLLLILLAGFSLFFGTANPLIHIPLVSLGYPAALFLLGRNAQSSREAAFVGWLAGVLASTLCVYWLVVPVYEYGGFPFLLALPIPLVFGFIHGLYAALFVFIVYRAKCVQNLSEYALIGFTFFAWFFVEWLRSWLLTGFTWLNLTAANAAFPLLIQGASVLGMQGLSALFALIACAFVARKRTIQISAFLMLCFVIALGAMRMQEDLASNDVDTGHFALIQGNLLPEEKWNAKLQEDSLNKYLMLSEQAIIAAREHGIKLDFIVFPETALPFFIQDNTYLARKMLDFTSLYEIPILTGAISYTRESKNGLLLTDIYNSVFLINPSEDLENYTLKDFIDVVYSKQHLLPFGEYIPPLLDHPLLQVFFAQIGAFTPAQDQEVLEYQDHRLGFLICYEAIFSYLGQDAVEKNAQVLINISNDAWYAYSSAAKQHFDLSVVRAIEQDRYILRATNTGITTAINPYGQSGTSPEMFTDSIVIEEIGYRDNKTIYHKIEPYLSYFINLIFFLFVCILSQRSRKQNREPN